MEALALAHHAGYWVKTVTKIKGDAVEELDLDGFEPVPEVQGLTCTWWRGKGSLIAICRGEAVDLAAPHCREAHVYGGLDERASAASDSRRPSYPAKWPPAERPLAGRANYNAQSHTLCVLAPSCSAVGGQASRSSPMRREEVGAGRSDCCGAADADFT